MFFVFSEEVIARSEEVGENFGGAEKILKNTLNMGKRS